MVGKLILLPRSFRESQLLMKSTNWFSIDGNWLTLIVENSGWYLVCLCIRALKHFFFGSSTRSAVRQILHPTMEKTRRKMKKMWKTLALAAFLCSSALQGKTFGRAILQKGWPSARHVSGFFCLLVAESASNTVLFACFSSWLFPSRRLVVVSNSPRRKERERDDGQAAAGTHPRVLGAGKRRFGFRVASAELPRGFREFRGQNGFKITSQSTSGYRDDLPSCAKPPWMLTAQHLFHTNRINIYSCTACEPWCICICICVSVYIWICICICIRIYVNIYIYIWYM